jgi:protein phosphatase
LLRDGELTQITRDQTLVQSLVDEGQITPEEALTHPRRSWILRALDGRDESDPDVELLTSQPGDRYLLCSDGLSDYVDVAAIADALGQGEPQQASEALVDLALRAGAPDNVTCVVADPIEKPRPGQQPVLGGAATATPRIPTAAEPTPSEDPIAAEDGGRHAVERGRRRIGTRLAIVAGVVVVLIGAAIAITATYIHRQWYVAQSEGKVTIYHGVKGTALGYDLSHVHQITDLPATALPYDDQSNVRSGINTSGGLTGAQREVDTLRSDACALAASTAPTPSPTPSTVTGKRHKHHLRKAIPKPTLPSWCPTTPSSATP